MNHVTIPFATLLFVLFAGCSSPTDKPESPVSSLAELQARMSELTALHGEVRLHAHTEADDSEFFRWGNSSLAFPLLRGHRRPSAEGQRRRARSVVLCLPVRSSLQT